jgi:iron complex outermembrane recepter protein
MAGDVMKSSVLKAGASALALSFVVSGVALAQAQPMAASEAAAADAEGASRRLEAVVVTAQKRTEDLQDTPIAISVLGDQALEVRGVKSLVDLGNGTIPSLKVAPFFSRPGALIMNIRGIGVLSDSNQPARDQGVGVYIDGVYLGRPQGLGAALYDVASIEVLKGPQGTLFGRNTSGGAVNIVTKKPSGDFKLNALAGIGNYGAYKSELRFDLPQFWNISAKFDGVITAREGWVDNPLASAEDFGSYERRGLRVAFLWEPTERLSAEYAYDNSYDATSTNWFQLLATGSFRQAARGIVQANRAKVAVAGLPQQLSIGRTWGHRLGVDWDLNDTMLVKYIGSYRDLTQSQWDNANYAQSLANPTGNFLNFGFGRYSLAPFKQDQFSHEIQLIGDTPRFKYVAGALYYRENVEDSASAFNTARFTDAIGQNFEILSIDYTRQRIDRASRVQTTSMGVFGQGTWTPQWLDERLHLTLGARWTKDEKVGSLFIVNGALPVVNGVSAARQLDSSWDRVDPLVNVAFDITDNVMVYGRYSSGYKSGGANSRSLFYAPFDPETVTMFEVGTKAELWDGRVRFNAAAYTGTYADIQLDFSAQYIQIDPVTNQVLTTLRTTTETTNAPGEGDISGAEFDLTLALTDNLTLSASYAHTIVDIPPTINPFRQADGRFITVPIPIYQVYTPENAGSISIDYERPFLTGNFLAHLEANWDDGFYANYTDVAYDPVTRAVTIPQPKGDESFNVNGRVSLADVPVGPGFATFSLWSRNLFDNEYVFYRSKSPLTGTAGFFNDPRTFGFEVKLTL